MTDSPIRNRKRVGTFVYLDPDIKLRSRLKAVREGRTFSDLVNSALAQDLKMENVQGAAPRKHSRRKKRAD